MKIQIVVVAACVAMAALVSGAVLAETASLKSVASLYQNKAALAGKTISAKGKVVKVNNEIMGRNFIHVQDGTGDAKTNDLLVTSKQTAKVGDQVTISGVVAVNKDFGSGYVYALLIEDATVTVKK